MYRILYICRRHLNSKRRNKNIQSKRNASTRTGSYRDPFVIVYNPDPVNRGAHPVSEKLLSGLMLKHETTPPNQSLLRSRPLGPSGPSSPSAPTEYGVPTIPHSQSGLGPTSKHLLSTQYSPVSQIHARRCPPPLRIVLSRRQICLGCHPVIISKMDDI